MYINKQCVLIAVSTPINNHTIIMLRDAIIKKILLSLRYKVYVTHLEV